MSRALMYKATCITIPYGERETVPLRLFMQKLSLVRTCFSSVQNGRLKEFSLLATVIITCKL